MKKIALLLLLSIFVLTGCFGFGGESKVVMKTDSGEHEFIVEVADTKEKRATGLMNRELLDYNRGMIFVYDEAEIGRPAFWMKNTLIPLDMVFMDADFNVVAVFEDVQPCESDPCPHYIPAADSNYVVELTAGTIKRIALKIGDSVVYN